MSFILKRNLIIFLSVHLCLFIRSFYGALALITVVLPLTSTSGGPCDKIENYDYSWFKSIRTCYMTSAIIDSADFLLTSTRDDSVKKFDADGNKNLEYLPTKIGEKFPNLVRLNAGSCSLKKSSQEILKVSTWYLKSTLITTKSKGSTMILSITCHH